MNWIKYTVHDVAGSGKDFTVTAKNKLVIVKILRYLSDFHGGIKRAYFPDLKITVHDYDETELIAPASE